MRRLFWCLNHRTLMEDETRILRSLGWSVFTPRILPRGIEARSTKVEREPDDAALNIPSKALDFLKGFPYYERIWSPTLAHIINRYFDVVVTPFYYPTFSSAVRHFGGNRYCFAPSVVRESRPTANYWLHGMMMT